MSGSGSGVMRTCGCQGIPNGSAPTASRMRARNSSAIDSCTKKILSAVQRWPLKLSAPVTASLTAFSRSASGMINAGFLASRPSTPRIRCGKGCCCLSMIAHLARSNERQHVDLSAAQDRLDDLRSAPVNEINHSRREAFREGGQERLVNEGSKLGRLDHHRVAHDQRRDKGGVGFVQRVIERAHRKAHPERRAPDLGDDAAVEREARTGAVEILERVDGAADVLDRAVELLAAVVQVLADFPHQQAYDLFARRSHAGQELFHGFDPARDAHRRPCAVPAVPGPRGRVERGHRSRDVHNGRAPD